MNQIDGLSTLGDYAVVLLTRRDMAEIISYEDQEKLALVDGIPGGFVRLKLQGDAFVPVYFSEGFKKLVNMDEAELTALYGRNSLTGVNPEDLGFLKKPSDIILAEGESFSARYRLRRGGGGYQWVTIFAKAGKDRSGETFLNVYYTDAAAQQKQERIQTELLDNLPCGAALFEIHGDQLSVIHLNHRYWELVKRAPQPFETIRMLDAIYPEDQHIVLDELSAAIRQQRDPACSVRIVSGDGSYQMFHIIGHIVRENDGRSILCAIYSPVRDENLPLPDPPAGTSEVQ